MKFIFPRFNLFLFSEEGRHSYEEICISDDPLLFQHEGDLFEGVPFLDHDRFRHERAWWRAEQKPIDKKEAEKEEYEGAEKGFMFRKKGHHRKSCSCPCIPGE